MRLLSLAVLPLAFIATASLGAGWESGMQEDEGGPAMMAWVYGGEGDFAPELRMMCGDEVVLRYGLGPVEGGEPQPLTEPASFTFDFGGDIISLDMQYEEMDGMYAAYFPTDALIIGYLRTAASVKVEAPSPEWPVREFTLQGSSKAIAALLKTCG